MKIQPLLDFFLFLKNKFLQNPHKKHVFIEKLYYIAFLVLIILFLKL